MKILAIVFALVLIMLLLYGGCRERAINNNWKEILQSRDDSIKRFKNQMGEWVHEKKVLQLTVDGLRASEASEVKALKKQVGNLNNLIEKHSFTLRNTARITTILYDTVYEKASGETLPARSFTYSDRWLQISGVIADSLHLEYLYNDTIQRAVFYKRKGKFLPKLFGRLELVEQISTSNPNTSIPMMQTFVMKPEPKKWYATRGFQLATAFAFGYGSAEFFNRRSNNSQ